MKKLRLRESKVEAFMKKKGYKDIYDMKDRLLVSGYELVIISDKTMRDKLAIVWWWVRKVVALVATLAYYPLYLVPWLAFAAVSIVRGVLLLFMLKPNNAARCFVYMFNPDMQ